MGPALRGAAVIQGGQGRPPLQGRTGTVRNGTSGTACPTHSVIARSEATRQSVLPIPKRRIPTPVTRSLARNDSSARWERRDTWVPPYGVRRSSRADRGVRPYKAKQEPCKMGRRGRRPLRNHKGYVQRGGQRRPPLQGRTRTAQNGTSRTPSPTHSVIARSEATRQSVLPSPKRRIPAPVCTPRALASRRALARNDSAARWERRDTWVPPYGVRRSSRAGRRGRRPLQRDVVPQGHLFRCAPRQDAVPYTLCHCEERSDAAIRSPQPKETDSHASDTVTGAE